MSLTQFSRCCSREGYSREGYFIVGCSRVGYSRGGDGIYSGGVTSLFLEVVALMQRLLGYWSESKLLLANEKKLEDWEREAATRCVGASLDCSISNSISCTIYETLQNSPGLNSIFVLPKSLQSKDKRGFRRTFCCFYYQFSQSDQSNYYNYYSYCSLLSSCF